MTSPSTADIRARCAAIERASRAWLADPHLSDDAVRSTADVLGCAPSAVRRQLERILLVAASRRADVLTTELVTITEHSQLGDPAVVLHLASGGVPGLLIESMLPVVALGVRSQARPSRGDVLTASWLDAVQRLEPELADIIELVEQIDWQSPDAAIVWGEDQTIELVRRRLRRGATVVGFGTRTSLALIDGQATASQLKRWIPELADDVSRFSGNGCMSPLEWLIVDPAESTLAQVESMTEEMPLRSLLSITACSADELLRVLHSHPIQLQTVVVAAEGACAVVCGEAAAAAGAFRMCAPGQAHDADPLAAHEGMSPLAWMIASAPQRV